MMSSDKIIDEITEEEMQKEKEKHAARSRRMAEIRAQTEEGKRVKKEEAKKKAEEGKKKGQEERVEREARSMSL